MKPKFRKNQIVWVKMKIIDPILDHGKLNIFDESVDLRNIRPNVTRKQLEKWYQNDVEKGCFERLCKLLGIE